MTLFWIQIFSLLCSLTLTSSYRCDASQFGNLVKGKRLSQDILERIQPGGLALCARECLYRKRCLSFNYVDSSDTCEFVGAIDTGNLDTVSGTYYSEKSTWPTNIAGLCKAHTCSESEKCVQQATMFTCKHIYYTVLHAADTEMKKGIVDTINGITKDDCIKECLYRSICLVYNYKPTSICELGTLVMVTDMTNYIGNSPGSLYRAISQHDSTVVGKCASSPCTAEEVCQEDANSYICIRNYCRKPTETVFDHVIALYDQGKELWLLSTNLTYKCQDGYYPKTMWNCQPDGTWTSPSCTAITGCGAIYKADMCDTPNRVDALYILKFTNTEQDIILYCKVTDPINWIHFTNIGTTYSYYSTNISVAACRIHNSCGTTIFSKLRAIPTPVAEYLNDRTHSTKTCQNFDGPLPGKAGKNCSSLCNIPNDKGKFQIDLRGTGLKFEKQTYVFNHGTLQYTHDDQVVSAECDDCADICSLNNKKTLAAVGSYVNYTGAIRPTCKTLG